MSRFWIVSAVSAVAILAPVREASASRIDLVTASTNMGAGFGTLLVNTVNGVGLSVPTLTAPHASTIPSNSWVSTTGTLTGQLTYSFGAEYFVSGFSFWNQNAGGPGAAGSTGIQGVNVQFSTDGVLFLPVPGAPLIFSRVMGFGPVGPEMFSFAPVSATHFRFLVLSNYGDSLNTGYAEVGFDGVQTAIPEPASIVLLGMGLAAGAARLRKRLRP